MGHGAAKSRDAVLRIIPVQPVSQPPLPDIEIEGEPFEWPDITRQWWDMWASSPLSADFTDTDWSELRDTAMLHARFWAGDHKVAPELRLRVAKFGATPEDRARLRIQFATADHVEQRGAGSPAVPQSNRRRLVGE